MKKFQIQNESIADILYEKIDDIKRKYLKNKDWEIWFWGVNGEAEEAIVYLEKCGIAVSGIVDIDIYKSKLVKEGKMDRIAGKFPISNPEELIPADKKRFFIIANINYNDICMQLKGMGYDPDRQTAKLDINIEDKSRVNEKKKLDISELRGVEIELLKRFAEFCEERKIRYSLGGGTLLGAIRHKGYIPWDDDIDVMMPTPDYKRFISEFEEDDTCRLINHDNAIVEFRYTQLYNINTIMHTVKYPIITTSAVSIDIFPICAMPTDPIEKDKYMTEVVRLRHDWDLYWIRREDDEIIEYQKLVDRANHILYDWSFEEADTVGYLSGGKLKREMSPQSDYDEFIRVKFEDREYYSIKNYDPYLRRLYGGDYMIPPDETHRSGRHDILAWWNK